MSKNKEMTFKDAFVEGLENFFQTKRVLIWTILGIIAAAVIFFVGLNAWTESKIEKSTLAVEEAQEIYANWMAEENETEKEKLAESLLAELAEVIEKYPTRYAAQRALFLRGKYYIQVDEWEPAAQDFLDLAEAFPQSVLAEESLLNAASCYEELGNYSQAITLHQDFQDKFSNSLKISYSLFSLGRLYEMGDNYTDAAEVYRTMEEDYLTSGWTKLAQNRLIYIEVNGLEN